MIKNFKRLFSLLEGSYGLTEDQLAYQSLALNFAATEMAPYASDWDKNGYFPVDVLRKAGNLGFGGIYVSDKYGGCNLGKLEATIILESLAKGCLSTSSYISIHNMCNSLLDSFGTDIQKSKWQEKLCKMEFLASYCLTEPGSGSNAGAMLTTVKKDGKNYVINGSKAFISGGEASDLYFVILKTAPKEISCVIIEKNTPGLSFGKKEDKLGWRNQPTQIVLFDDCRVPEENLLGVLGNGMKIAMKSLEGGRLTVAACALGGGWIALEKAAKYMEERSQFGKKLKDMQHLRFRMADCLAKLTESRILTRAVASLIDLNTNTSHTCCAFKSLLDNDTMDKSYFTAIAKMRVTDTCYEIADECLQMFGGYGLLRDYGIERILRDLRVLKIVEGTNEIMKYTISKSLFPD